MSNSISSRVLLLAITVLPAAPTGWSQSISSKSDEARRLAPISVFGRGAELIGEAEAASEGTVGYEDFKDRPLARAGELIEVIPGAVGTVLSGGMLMRFDALSLSARLRHFGGAPLVEDGSVTSDPTTIVNLGVTRDFGPVSLSLDVLNALDADDAYISYFFESRLTGETGGVEDLHFHPVEPRQLRLSARYTF